MGVRERYIEGVLVLEASGAFWGGAETDALVTAAESYIERGNARIVIDVRAAEHFNSRAIGMLVGIVNSAANSGGRLAISRVVGSRIHNMLVQTKLEFGFHCFDSIEDAVSAVNSASLDLSMRWGQRT
jgi:anti-anti-sigma regulatory factor